MAQSNTYTSVSTSQGGSGIFKGLKTPRELLNYNLMRGVTDFSNLEQWDMYEKGYPFLVVLSIPQFLADLRDRDPDGIGVLVDNYIHILENDFRGIDNIENITGESGSEITNGIRSISLINRVVKPSNTQFTMQYYERSGSVLTKCNELYLTGIKDGDTQVKHYHGLVDDWVFNGVRTKSGMDPGFHQECFSFMYFVTDNTMTKIERAFLIAAAQPNVAAFQDLYSTNKGDIQFVEIGMSFNGFFINNDFVYQKAQDMLLAMRNPKNMSNSRIIVDSNNFKYKAIAEAGLQSSNDPYSTPEYWSYSDGNAAKSADSIATSNVRGNNTNVYSPVATSIENDQGQIITDPTQAGSYRNLIASMNTNGGEHATAYLDKNDGNMTDADVLAYNRNKVNR